MKIFVSWSGPRSQIVAEALRQWLPCVFQSVDPWLSSSDIQPGNRWAQELGDALDQSHFGILSLTAENLTAPWVLFEAGALSKAIHVARVVPYLLDIDTEQLPPPLSQFQAVPANKNGTLRLINAISEATPANLRPANLLDRVFKRWWPDLEAQLSRASGAAAVVLGAGDSGVKLLDVLDACMWPVAAVYDKRHNAPGIVIARRKRIPSYYGESDELKNLMLDLSSTTGRQYEFFLVAQHEGFVRFVTDVFQQHAPPNSRLHQMGDEDFPADFNKDHLAALRLYSQRGTKER
jgi:hypothetical protein